MKKHPPGRIIVTGGGSGLGAAIVEVILDAGGTPFVFDHDVSKVSGVKSLQVDVSNRDAVEKAVHEAAESLGGIDGVVTAAGIDRRGTLGDIPADEWEQVIGVNLVGTVSVVRAALPYLKESHGRATTIASTLGIRAVPEATAYCAAEFGIIGFSRALAAETRGTIGVTTIIPGRMKTRAFDHSDDQYKPPAGSMLNDPEDVAHAVVFALSQPIGSEVRELVICPAEEASWP
ncbi:SDR family oxidoreductase [Arthrobacter celericrescens]|uniref:SDR family oxidoreductase n=1 Tax=Arthrobacter celericrescens TaxID=2320851 RepID=UPI000EA26C8F|nr:SDR family oxidoreductase [Arthrobacter celericrescens]